MAERAPKIQSKLLEQIQDWKKTLTESDTKGDLEIPSDIANVLRDYFRATASKEELVFLYNGEQESEMILCFGQAGQAFFRETEWLTFVQRHGIKQADTVSFDRVWHPMVLQFFISLLSCVFFLFFC